MQQIPEIQSDYHGTEPILVAVDCIIFGFDKEHLKLLLFKRKVQPFKDEWSLIGSFVKSGEPVGAAAERVLAESTGLNDVYMKELGSFGQVDRDPGGRVISIAHYALIRLDDRKEHLVNEYHAKWFDVDDIPSLILDHNEMVKNALAQLKHNTKYFPIGFELLPQKFTIPQLRALYESIYQRELDRRNFRKKILSMQILKKMEEKDKSTSKKGAYYYQFDEVKYKQLEAEGFIFQL